MAASKSPPSRSDALDPKIVPPTAPFDPKRDTFPLDMQRVQSGSLADDPAESGAPVQDGPKPYKNLKGGR